ncbi:MAG: amidase [Calditrichia bacterium]
MDPAKEIIQLTASEMRERLIRREISPVEVVQACLEQIERHNPAINAICTVNVKALDEAERLEREVVRGKSPGLLYGLPLGIKDVTPTAGIRTTFGSPLFADYIPEEDALVVQRLKKAGAIIIGKTNTPEFAAGGNTFNEVFGRTRNPWNLQLSAGGSTGGGAAALATGRIALAEGTDLGGSLRMPASFCGVVGLRPSPGLVPTWPSEFLWDNLNVSGPMARTVEDAALMLQAIAGPHPLVPMVQPAKGRNFVKAVQSGISEKLRIAYCRDIAGIGIDPDVESVCRRAAFELAQAGAEVQEIEFDLSAFKKAFATIRGFWMAAHYYKYLDRLEHFGENLRGNIRTGLKVTMEELASAEQARSRLWLKFYDFFMKYDHLLTPTMAVAPFPVEQNYPTEIAGKKMKTYIDWFAPTFLLSLSGLPVASVPCGLDKNNLPVGMQIVGPQMGEEKVLALAKLVQEANPICWPKLTST